MQWEVIGADRNTGDERTIILDADNEASATRRGNRQGLMVSAARPLSADDSTVSPAIRPRPKPAIAPAATIPYAGPFVAAVHRPEPPAVGRSANGLGVASLVIGIVALLISWVPLIGLMVLPLAVIGLILGGVGIVMATTNRRSGVGFPIAGAAVCLLAAIVPVLLTMVLAGAAAHGANAFAVAAAQQAQAQARAQPTQIRFVPPPVTFPRSAPPPVAIVPAIPSTATSVPLALADWSFSSGKDEMEQGFYEITVSLRNTGEKPIKLIDASVQFNDLLGDHLYRIKVTPDLNIAPGVTSTDKGRYHINQFSAEESRMKNMKQADILATLDVAKIVFADNTVLSVER